MRDFQRSAVYAWETSFMSKDGHGDLTLDECQQLVNLIFEGKRKPLVKDGRGRRAACFQASRLRKAGFIKLPLWARRRWVVCHEAAHALVRYEGYKVPAHGAYFMRVYLDLLVKHCGYELSMLEQSAQAAGIKIYQEDDILLAA